MYTVGKPHNLPWLTVAAHETYTRHITSIAVQQTVQKVVIQQQTYIFLQLRAMAARTTVWTLREVKRKRNLSRYILEHYVV
jgi:hypothetical protein